MMSGQACRPRTPPRPSAGSSQGYGNALSLDDARFVFIAQVLEDALVVDHDQRAVLLDDFTLGGEDTAGRSGCLQGRCTARCPARSSSTAGRRGCDSPLLTLRVVDVPQLGTLVLRVPAVLCCRGTSRRALWRGTSLHRDGRRRKRRRNHTCRVPASGPRSS